MGKKNKLVIFSFITVLLLAVFAIIYNLPLTNTRAYHSGGTSGSVQHRDVPLIVKAVDENGNTFTNTVFTVKTERYNEDDQLVEDDDSGLASTFTLGEEIITNNFLDSIAKGNQIFDKDKENLAIITLTQTKAEDNYNMANPVVIHYRYYDENNPSSPYYTSAEEGVSYRLDVELVDNASGAATLEIEPGYYGIGGYTLIIKNLPKDTTTYTDKYSYEGDLPQDVMDTLPAGGGTYYRDDVLTPVAPVSDSIKIGHTTYTFNSWTPSTFTFVDKDAEFIGKWDVVEDLKYTEKYSYEGDLPQEVLETLPTRANEYYDGDTVNPVNPSKTSLTIGDKIYTFDNWNPTSVVINGKNAEFVGKWSVEDATDEEEKEIIEFDITYKLNGGNFNGNTKDIVERHEKDSLIKIHEAPVKKGYKFLYWQGSIYYPNDDYKVVEDHVFNAIWEKIPNPQPEPTPTPKPTIPKTSVK